jgi:hypothetical protein
MFEQIAKDYIRDVKIGIVNLVNKHINFFNTTEYREWQKWSEYHKKSYDIIENKKDLKYNVIAWHLHPNIGTNEYQLADCMIWYWKKMNPEIECKHHRFMEISFKREEDLNFFKETYMWWNEV